MNTTASIQIGQTLRTITIAPTPLSAAATSALRTFWGNLGDAQRATLNANVSRIIESTKAPAVMHSEIALRVLWGSLDLLSLDAAWDAFAASSRWPALA